MPKSTLIVYQPIDSFGKKSSYWKEYCAFYEKYWGGPTSPLGVWFGNEYRAFRESLSSQLGIDEEDIEDCFFMTDDQGKYHVAPFDSKQNLLYSENCIPLYWFVLFNQKQRQILFTHWGYNAIYYDSKIRLSIERLEKAEEILEVALNNLKNNLSSPLVVRLSEIRDGVSNLVQGLSRFDCSGYVVVNYGDICSFIHPYTLNNENSVGEIWDIFSLLTKNNFEKAESDLNILKHKWEDIRKKASGEGDKSPLQ